MHNLFEIRQIAPMLGYRDIRTAKRFLKKAGVSIFSIKGMKQKYIRKIDFHLALKKNLRDEAGVSVEEIQATMNVFATHFTEREHLHNDKIRLHDNAREQNNSPVNIGNCESRVIVDTAMEQIPDDPKKFYPGVVRYCNYCNTDIDKVCRQNNKSVSQCPFIHKHKIKQYVHIPGTRNKRKTFTIESTRKDDIIVEAIRNKQFVLGQYPKVEQKDGIDKPKLNNEPVIEQKEKVSDKKTILIKDAIENYLKFLRGEKDVSENSWDTHSRGKSHVRDVSLGLKYLTDSLYEANYSPDGLFVGDIDKRMAIVFYNFLHARNFSVRTIEKHLNTATSMCTWLNDEGYQNPNFFKHAPRKKATIKEIRTITKEEFSNILNAMDNEELGKETLSTGEVKYLWKKWISDSAELKCYTGRRTDEIFELSTASIVRDDNNEMLYLKSFDLKINRIKNLTGDQRRFVYVPISLELKSTIEKLLKKNARYMAEYGSENCYLIAPEEKMQRDTMSRHFIRAFNHYAKAVYPKDKITAGILRKTYISKLSAEIGVENCRSITKHSSFQVMAHYLDPRILMQTQNFSVFGRPSSISNEHEKELREIRSKSKTKQQTKTPER